MRVYIPILFIALASIGYLGLTKCKRTRPVKTPVKKIPIVESQTVQPEAIQLHVKSQCTVQAAIHGSINVEVSGKIISTEPAYQVGGNFQKGDVLLTLDSRDYEARKAQADANLTRAQLALMEEEARGAQARKEWEATGKDSTAKPSPLVLRVPQLTLARHELHAARQAADIAALNLQRTKLLAPYDGVLTEKLAEIGQVVAGGPATPIAKAYSSSILEARLPVSSREITFLELENKPTVEIQAEIGRRTWTWKAHIDRDAGRIDPQTRFHHLVALINLNETEPGQPKLQPGQFITATIRAKSVPNLYRVPRHAFVEATTLFIVSKENTLLKRNVVVLHSLGDEILVRDGLSPGDTICLTRLQFMNNGLKVQLVTDQAGQEPVPSKR